MHGIPPTQMRYCWIQGNGARSPACGSDPSLDQVRSAMPVMRCLNLHKAPFCPINKTPARHLETVRTLPRARDDDEALFPTDNAYDRYVLRARALGLQALFYPPETAATTTTSKMQKYFIVQYYVNINIISNHEGKFVNLLNMP